MINFKKISFIIFGILLSELLLGQTVLLHESIRDYDFKMPNQGPNFRHFNHLSIGYAFFVPSDDVDEVQTKPGTSTIFSLGWRYKLKITNWLAIGAGINYTNEIFNIKQIEGKVVPDTILHSKEKLRSNNFGPDGFIRINFGKRGNIIGRFIDLGAYCNWPVSIEHMYEDDLDQTTPNGARLGRVILSKLNYVERFQYGLKARIGINRFVLTGTYRLNEFLTQEYKNEVGNYFFPKLALGIEIGLHK